ncbi:MAG: hypothetical protein H8E15_06600 [Planctomycetes bacterium]|nr:hypothetical protein [Planctomycetota bacterium]
METSAAKDQRTLASASSDSIRWQLDAGMNLWIGESISIGDSTASVAAGLVYNTPLDVKHPAGSSQPIFANFSDASRFIRVDAADDADVSAAMVLMGSTPGQFTVPLTAEVRFYEGVDQGVPAWTWKFPPSSAWYVEGGGVRVSDDGETVVAWWSDFDSGLVELVGFNRSGSEIARMYVNPTSGSFTSAQAVEMSDAGDRILISGRDKVVVFDVANNRGLHWDSPTLRSIRDIAFAGDGKSYAVSLDTHLEIWKEDPDGIWRPYGTVSVPFEHRGGPMAMNHDGGRLAFCMQRLSFTGFEIGLLEVNGMTEYFRTVMEEPATSLQLYADDMEIDDAGERIAVASWGDMNHTTPEGFVLDATGQILLELRTSGSAFDIDLDPTGQVVALATKVTHANLAAAGGSVLVADVIEPGLRVLGYPELNGSVTLEIPGKYRKAQLAIAKRLGDSLTPFGISQLDLHSVVRQVGPMDIPPSGLMTTIELPSQSYFMGTLLHLQAAVEDQMGTHLSNRVSIRLLP